MSHEAAIKTHLILIDDNDIDQLLNRKIIETVLPQAHIIQFLDAQKALSNITSNQISHHTTILLDIKMPVMDGFQFLEAYDKLNENIKQWYTIYLLSSSLNQYDISKAKSNPYVKDMIIKPLTKDTLLNLLR